MFTKNFTCKSLLILFIISVSTAVFSQEWFNTYNGQSDSDDKGYGIVVDSDGNIITSGYATNDTSGIDITLLKYSNSGTFIWRTVYKGTGYNTDKPLGIIVDNSNNIYVCGFTTKNNGNIDLLTIKYNSAGIQQWAKTYNGSGNGEDKAWGIVVDNNGNCYVTGVCMSSGAGNDFVTIKYNTNGTAVWTKTYDAPSHKDDAARNIALDATGNIYVSGYGEYNPADNDMIILKYNSGGVIQWVKNFNGITGGNDEAWGIVVDATNNIYVTGESDGQSGTKDISIIKYNSSGALLWSRIYNGNENKDDKPYGILAEDISGTIIVTGTTGTVQRGTDVLTLALNSNNGVILWNRLFDGSGHNDDTPYAMTKSRSEVNPHIFITGKTRSGSTLQSEDIPVISYSFSGAPLNSVVYNGQANLDDGAFGIAVDTNDNYYIAGYIGVQSSITSMVPSYDIVAMKYKKLLLTGTGNQNTVPLNFYLTQNYPNPFNPATVISFGIPFDSFVKLSVFDINGKLVAEPVNNFYTKGEYSYNFSGNGLSSGIYIYSLQTEGFIDCKKMILIK